MKDNISIEGFLNTQFINFERYEKEFFKPSKFFNFKTDIQRIYYEVTEVLRTTSCKVIKIPYSITKQRVDLEISIIKDAINKFYNTTDIKIEYKIIIDNVTRKDYYEVTILGLDADHIFGDKKESFVIKNISDKKYIENVKCVEICWNTGEKEEFELLEQDINEAIYQYILNNKV